MAKQEFSIPKLASSITSEADAYRKLEELRWGGDPTVCPKCGTEGGKFYFLNPANGTSRKTRTGSVSERRVWKCGSCRKQFSVLTDTIFHGTKISVRTWLLVIFEFVASKNSVSAWEISRKYEITNESAWHMLHRIREAMKREPVAGLMSGAIQADETWIGGNPANRHRNDPRERPRKSNTSDKQPVFSLVHYETREVRSFVVNDVRAETLWEHFEAHTVPERVWLQTDASTSYRGKISKAVADHQYVDHAAGEYVGTGGASTNLAEAFFSMLKRAIRGTHMHVSIEHLHRYLAQADFMWTNNKMTDSERMRLLLGRVLGRRLTYKPLAG